MVNLTHEQLFDAFVAAKTQEEVFEYFNGLKDHVSVFRYLSVALMLMIY